MIRTIALICTHNGDRFLQDQVTSIVSQTCSLNTIYIFDFASIDNTREVIYNLVNQHECIKSEYVDFAPGPALSFFYGIERIRLEERGDYLLYLVDQDDVWMVNKSEFVLNEFETHKLDFAFHDVEIVDAELNLLRPSYYGHYWRVKRDYIYPNQLFSNCVIGHTCILHSDFVRLLSIPMSPKIPMHDWHIANQAIVFGRKTKFLDVVLGKYRQHDRNILGSSKSGFFYRLRRMLSYSKVLNNYHDYLRESEPHLLNDYNPKSMLLIIGHQRPLRKLVYVLFIKFIFRL